MPLRSARRGRVFPKLGTLYRACWRGGTYRVKPDRLFCRSLAGGAIAYQEETHETTRWHLDVDVAAPGNALGSAAEPPRYYAMRMGDKLIGYATTSSEKLNRDGKDLVRLKSETSLKVVLLGKERNVVSKSETLIDSETGKPVHYQLTNTTNEVVSLVESAFADGVVRTWSHRLDDDRGDPVETRVSDNAVMVLGSNNFANWQALLSEATKIVVDGKATITVFVPEAQQVDRLELVRGETKDVTLAGSTRKAIVWRLEKGQMELLVDADTSQFRMHLPAEKTTVELADESVVKLVRKMQAEELLAGQFLQSNVTFDDYLKVTRLEAQVDAQVIGSGVGNDVSVLTTGMQVFDGQKDGSQIKGTVTVTSFTYQHAESPAFPLPVTDSALQRYLEPSVCIESDHEPIATKSAELTQGAKDRWDAVLRIGRWVNKEIAYTIADTPSARLALEKKKGDCGPHSTLTIALLRAAGIPSRLVGGVVYTPSFGGSFGQHGWVEVHMGPAEWVAIDPTTGEFDRMSATHIKLFEGMGGVKPKAIHVTEYEPTNELTYFTPPDEAQVLAWQYDQEYVFRYRKGGKELGEESFRIAKQDQDGVDVLELTSDVKLKLNVLSSLVANTKLFVSANARPVSFERDFSVLLKKTKVKCLFRKRVAHVEISGSQNLSRDIQLPEDVFCFDNNLMSSWVVICSQLPLEPNKPLTIRTFHPSSLQIIPVTITAKAPAAITIGGKDIECFECSVDPIKNTFWITRDGRFVRASQGDLVIELKELD